MKTLNENQKQFLLDAFFVNNHFSGWRGIAEKLLEKGKCIVAGDGGIWKGGIGNFILIKKDDDYMGCVEYSFDLEEFLESELYKYTKESYMEDLATEVKQINSKFNDIAGL